MTNTMSKVLLFILFLMLIGCYPKLKDTFNSSKLVSSKGEKIYVNSINWGITDDYQITKISSHKNRIKSRIDTLFAVKGLEPFIYSFKNDSLTLFFNNEISYRVKENFKTITVTYVALEAKQYKYIKQKSYDNDGYYSVPVKIKTDYVPDMPNPPSNQK